MSRPTLTVPISQPRLPLGLRIRVPTAAGHPHSRDRKPGCPARQPVSGVCGDSSPRPFGCRQNRSYPGHRERVVYPRARPALSRQQPTNSPGGRTDRQFVEGVGARSFPSPPGAAARAGKLRGRGSPQHGPRSLPVSVLVGRVGQPEQSLGGCQCTYALSVSRMLTRNGPMASRLASTSEVDHRRALYRLGCSSFMTPTSARLSSYSVLPPKTTCERVSERLRRWTPETPRVREPPWTAARSLVRPRPNPSTLDHAALGCRSHLRGQSAFARERIEANRVLVEQAAPRHV